MYRITWILLFMLGNAWAAPATPIITNHEHGIVNLHGSILITPCAINMADTFQSIELGTETTGEFQHEGVGPGRPFSIHLVNCNLIASETDKPAASWFQLTFDGPKDDTSLFGLEGASGAGLEISDDAGHFAHPGEPMPARRMTGHSMALNYMLRLAEDRHPLRAGSYRATVRFKIDYF